MQLIIKRCQELRTLTSLRPLPKMKIWKFDLIFKITIFDIQTSKMIEGDLPKTAKKLVKIWANLHRIELMEDWNLIKQGQNPINITPLE